MDVVIRKALLEDEEAFVHFSLELSRFNRSHHPQRDSFDDVLQARSQRAHVLFNSLDSNQVILMATLKGEYVGYALANVFYPDATNDNGTELCGLLDEVYVDASARGYGIGRQLIDGSITWMRQQGARRVKFQMYDWNKHARLLYEKMGFAQYAVSFEKYVE